MGDGNCPSGNYQGAHYPGGYPGVFSRWELSGGVVQLTFLQLTADVASPMTTKVSTYGVWHRSVWDEASKEVGPNNNRFSIDETFTCASTNLVYISVCLFYNLLYTGTQAKLNIVELTELQNTIGPQAETPWIPSCLSFQRVTVLLALNVILGQVGEASHLSSRQYVPWLITPPGSRLKCNRRVMAINLLCMRNTNRTDAQSES